jgi:predicted HD phosphohydrolase
VDLRRTKRAVKGILRSRGYELHPIGAPSRRSRFESEFRLRAQAIEERHRSQTRADVERLTQKYAEPVFGESRVWDLVVQQARCVDTSDRGLLLASQEVHVLQMLDAMQRDGVTDSELVLTAIIHDVGKLLLLTDEDPANVVGTNEAIGEYEDGCGLDACVFQWNHDEFAYTRFNEHVPDHVAWLLRYHSITPSRWLHLMDERDREYHERYFVPFTRYDQGTKSPFRLPAERLDDYRDLVERAFPDPIPF